MTFAGTKYPTRREDWEEELPELAPDQLDNAPPQPIDQIAVRDDIAEDFVPKNAEDMLKALGSWQWRMFSGCLYRIIIKGKEGEPDTSMPFVPNRAQRRFLLSIHNRNVILKARQLGITTVMAIFLLDHALFQKEQRCGMIAQNEVIAEEIFADKVKYAYDNLPEFLRDRFPTTSDSAGKLAFAHSGSSIRVATSMRGGTIHRLHVSEMGKIAKESPKKAREIVTGSLQAVPIDGIAVIESTAEGKEGEFFKIADRAEKNALAGKQLNKAEYRFFFFPWFIEPNYRLDPASVHFTDADHVYFDRLATDHQIVLDDWQRAFYVATRENTFSGDQEKMWQEWPSTSDECWMKSTEGTFYAPQLAAARAQNRITIVPHISRIRVNTFWDIGSSDGTGIWLHQYVGAQHRFIRYLEDWQKGYDHFVRQLRDTGYVFGGMFLPHDALQVRQQQFKVGSPLDMLQELAPDWNWIVVPQVQTLMHGIQLTRGQFNQYWFDKTNCAAGLEHLALYRKKWSPILGQFIDEHDHYGPHTEAADSLRQCAQGFDERLINAQKRPTRKSTRHHGANVL